MKRRREQERDEAIAREQADARREALLAELRARQAAGHEPEPLAAEPTAEPEPDEPPSGEPPSDEIAADEA